MHTTSRRNFIQNISMAITAGAFPGASNLLKNNSYRLSFTTLGCPDWNFIKIVDFAAKNGYGEIELRGIMRELDLTKCPDLSSAKINSTLRMVKDHGLKIICLGTSAHLHDADPKEGKSNLDEAKKNIDLAHKLNCPFIRVFPDEIPKGQQKSQTFDLVIKGLRDLADYAKDSKVSILMECSSGISGDFVKAEDLSFIMETAANPQVGIVWNPAHMWAVTKEPPALVYEKLKKYIKHAHIKDLKLVDGTIHGAVSYGVLLGKGDTPVGEAVKALQKGNYKGSYCCEWDKLWYPTIQEPEIVFPYYIKEIKKYFKN